MTSNANCQDGLVTSGLEQPAKTQPPGAGMVFDREIVMDRFQFISFYTLAEKICPDRLIEITNRYPSVPVNRPGPAHTVFDGILDAVNQLLNEEKKKTGQGQSASLPHPGEVATLNSRIRIHEEQVRSLKEQVEDLEKKLHLALENRGAPASTAGFPGLTWEDSQDPSACLPEGESDRSELNSRERFDPPEPPEEPGSWEPAGRMEAAKEDPFESQPVKDSARKGTSRSDEDEAEGWMSTVERVENNMTLDMAYQEWHGLDGGFSPKERLKVFSIVKIVGSGTVSTAEILENLQGMVDPQLNYHGVARYLGKMVEKYALLKRRKYLMREKYSLGPAEKAYELTILGRAAYRSIARMIEETPKDIELIAIYKTPDHCEFVDRATKGFRQLGLDAEWNFVHPAWNGVKLAADLMMISQERGTYYVFTLTHGQVKANKLTTKLKIAAIFNARSLYILMRKQAEAENEGWKAICYWAWNTHQKKDLTVYLLGLDYLEQLARSKAGSRIDPWFLQKTLRVSEQKNPFA
jgi:hypothetical protein